jgi:hypothetical protein
VKNEKKDETWMVAVNKYIKESLMKNVDGINPLVPQILQEKDLLSVIDDLVIAFRKELRTEGIDIQEKGK